MSILQIKKLRLKEINWYKVILLLRDRFKSSLNSVYAEEVRRYFLSIYVPGHILGSCVQTEFLLYLCVCVCVCVCVQSLSHIQLFVTSLSMPDSSVHGVL